MRKTRMIGRKWKVSEGSAEHSVSLVCVIIHFQLFLILHAKVRKSEYICNIFTRAVACWEKSEKRK